MPTFNPEQLATWTSGRWTVVPSCPLTGFTQDTRVLHSGDIFVALRTDKRDGHDFLAGAHAAGAAAAIVSRVNPALPIPQLEVADPLIAFQTIAREHRKVFQAAGGRIIGISGSCGKTSTKNLLASLLGGLPQVLATEGNLNNHIGVPLTLTRLDPAVHKYAVIEAGISGPGEMETLSGMIGPDHGIITMVAAAHTQELGGIEGVAREKSVLLRHVQAGGTNVIPRQCWEYQPFQDISTLVASDRDGDQVPAVIPPAKPVAYSLRFLPETTELTLSTGAGMSPEHCFTFRRVSRGMAQNATLAVILASRLGVPNDHIQAGLSLWRPSKWRGELMRDVEGRWFYLDFYNANPASMADALDTFVDMAPSQLPRLYVLGCMEELGDESARYHRALGRSLHLRTQDEVFVIGTQAEEVKKGVLDSAGDKQVLHVEVVDSVEPVAKRLADYRGAVFMKGSRKYALEKALPGKVGEGEGTH